MGAVKSDIEIARAAKMRPIKDILGKIKVPDNNSSFSPMGRHIAKINLEYLSKLKISDIFLGEKDYQQFYLLKTTVWS